MRHRARTRLPLIAVSAMHDVDTLVVGAGPVGSAAARHLSRDADAGSVMVVGPAEPNDHRVHDGVHGAWHDQARLTRVIAGDEVWAHLAQASIARYAEIRDEGGQDFHTPGSVLYVFEHGKGFEQHRGVAQSCGAQFVEIEGDGGGRFPYFRLPPGGRSLLEAGQAGVVNPRAMVANQLRAAESRGATVVRDVVIGLEPEAGGVLARLASGGRLRCRRAVVAAGAYVNSFGLLPEAAPVASIGITAHFFSVDDALADELAGMPGLLWFDDPAGGTFVYSVPPIRYPDGRLWFKIGGHRESGPLADRGSIDEWHRSDGGEMSLEGVRQWVAAHVPALAGHAAHSVGCVITESASAMPVITDPLPGMLVVATGCSGAAAKSCDEIGRIAAVLAVHGEWDSSLDRWVLSGR
ncbi:MAG: NAD(P)/FAD-dependent oxidoreductase [Actinomycetota bacterium]